MDTHNSLEISNDYNSYSFSQASALTEFIIMRSGKTTISKRSYYKLISALSFVGGLVAPTVAFFAFIFLTRHYGSLAFELKFARNYFHDKFSKIANGVHYWKFVKQLAYNFL